MDFKDILLLCYFLRLVETNPYVVSGGPPWWVAFLSDVVSTGECKCPHARISWLSKILSSFPLDDKFFLEREAPLKDMKQISVMWEGSPQLTNELSLHIVSVSD